MQNFTYIVSYNTKQRPALIHMHSATVQAQNSSAAEAEAVDVALKQHAGEAEVLAVTTMLV